MNKIDAIKMFGGTQAKLAAALGVTPQYISGWPDVLTVRQQDWVNGAAVRLGLLKVINFPKERAA